MHIPFKVRRPLVIVAALLTTALLAGCGASQEPGRQRVARPGSASVAAGAARDEPEQHPDINIGERAPTFSLKDQTDRARSLDELLKGGKLALVFVRSPNT
jgi:hypothetical protein